MTAALARFAPLAGISLLFAIGFGWRTWLQQRRYGTTGVVLFRQAGRWATARDALLIGLPLLLFAVAVGQALWPGGLPVGRLAVRQQGPAVALGAGLMLAGLVLMTAAQLQMGKSWRIGIDEAARPGLVTWGLYQFCRNPIFTAMLAALAGFFLLIPSVLTLVILLATYLGIRRQVAEEESYLRRSYAKDYQSYAAGVGRFVPWLGRL